MYENTVSDGTEQYADFIGSLKWDYWCTFTTPYELTLKSARRLMGRFHDNVKRSVGPNRLFWVAEPFDCRDGFHTHGLLAVDSRLPTQEEWEELNNSFQVVQGINKHGERGRPKIVRYNGGNAAAYCAKYIQKKKADYDLFL